MYGEYTNRPAQTTATVDYGEVTTATADFGEVVSVTQNYDGTTTVVFRKHQTVGQSWNRLNDWLNRTRQLVAYEPRVMTLPVKQRALGKPKFWPEASRAPMPEQRPVQAPPPQPKPHLLHFASPRVWARRNRAAEPQKPRRERRCRTTT